MARDESDAPSFERRGFVTLCASTVMAVTASPGILARSAGTGRDYQPALLIDTERRQAIRASSLTPGETYLFHYPYRTTPCFLVDLGEPVQGETWLETERGRSYRWSGGAGPGSSLVAFSAICAHKLSHPARSVSFIDYRHGPVTFVGPDEELVRREKVIVCCSEGSVYDPATGARVLGGPAPEPLSAISLEYDAVEDTLYATGTLGSELFEEYFAVFGHRLALDYETADLREPVREATEVMNLEAFSARRIRC
jgi:Rieske Fe-S protein